MDDEDNYEINEDYDDYNDDDDNWDDTGDAPYDVDAEEDKGDEEDIGPEIGATMDQDDEDRRYDEYEMMADEAALQGVDVVEDPSNSSRVLNVAKTGNGSRKGRCATKGLRITQPMHLKFDDLGRPVGKWRLKYGQHLGFFMRKININWNWKDVSEGKRKLMWIDTMSVFHIPDEKRLRKQFLSAVAKRFRDFKSKLVSGWITKTRKRSKFEDGREPPDIWKHIKVEDWRLFQQIKTSSPSKRKRNKAIESAKKNEHYHHLGQNDFNTARPIWIKDGFYPRCTSTSSEITIEVNRADDWYCAMHSKDKQTGKYVIKEPKTKEVADKIVELREKQIQGEFIAEGEKDALYYAFGEKGDHRGRVKDYGGVNIGVRQAFGISTMRTSTLSKSRISSEEREAIKKELREEMKDEVKSEVKSNVVSILRQMGLKLPDVGDVDKLCAEAVQVNLSEQYLPPIVKNDTPCRLFLPYPHSGVSYEVARGKTYPLEDDHQGSVVPDHVRVKISVVPEEFETLRLPVPVPSYDIYILSDAVGSFVQ